MAKKRIEFQENYETLEQYDFGGTDELTVKEVQPYARGIGNALIAFSALESQLNIALAEQIMSGSHDPGYRIVKYLKFADKWKLFSDLCETNIGFLQNGVPKTRLQTKVKQLVSGLENMGDWRNKIAHANWSTLQRSGYVRVSVREDRVANAISFRRIKITPAILYRISQRCYALSRELSDIGDHIELAHQREDMKVWRAAQKKKRS